MTDSILEYGCVLGELTEQGMSAAAGTISVGAGDGLEGFELARAGPELLEHDGDVRRAPARRVRGVEHEAVVHPGHHLLLAARDAAEPQPVAGQARLLRLAQRPPAQLLDARGAHVRDRAPPAHHRAGAAEPRCVGGGEREEGEEREGVGPRHGCRIGEGAAGGEGIASGSGSGIRIPAVPLVF
jgi:hypothetical protein